jgi:hypothetical protein
MPTPSTSNVTLFPLHPDSALSLAELASSISRRMTFHPAELSMRLARDGQDMIYTPYFDFWQRSIAASPTSN